MTGSPVLKRLLDTGAQFTEMSQKNAEKIVAEFVKAGELFKQKYGLDLVTVPFNGAALAVTDPYRFVSPTVLIAAVTGAGVDPVRIATAVRAALRRDDGGDGHERKFVRGPVAHLAVGGICRER